MSPESDSEGDEDKGKIWTGIAQVPDINHETDYEDEDKHTTVTIEAVNVTRDGLQKVVDVEGGEIDGDNGSLSHGRVSVGQPLGRGTSTSKRVWTKERPGAPKKKKKFRYESKAERKVTRYKERSGNKAKAKARKD